MPKEEKSALRVAIIGGGASGWASAEVLRDARWEGRFDVVVFEKNNYFGGKCRTVFPDGERYNGKSGGYEVGAGVISKGSKCYADLERLLKKYRISCSNVVEKARQKRRYYMNGRVVNWRYWLLLLLRRPTVFVKAAYGLIKYWFGLGQYSKDTPLEYHGRPAQLNKNLSAVYPHESNVCFAIGMQSYGYADLDDEELTPPLLYYHQYLTREVFINPLYTVDMGMQVIWSTVAASYPQKSKRLNAEVLEVKREASRVIVETGDGEEYFDYLIVAVPLGPGLAFMDFNHQEKALISKVTTNHYVSVLCRVSGLIDTCHVNVKKTVDRKDVGRIMFAYKRYVNSDWVNLNLYINPQEEKTDEEIISAVAIDLKDDFSAELLEPASAKVFHWRDYFAHLSTKDLDDAWYGQFQDLMQGTKRTLFVSCGLHMETVGASVQYATEKVGEIAQNWLIK